MNKKETKKVSIEQITKILIHRREGYTFRLCIRRDGKIKFLSSSNTFSAHCKHFAGSNLCSHYQITRLNMDEMFDKLKKEGHIVDGVIKCSFRIDIGGKHNLHKSQKNKEKILPIITTPEQEEQKNEEFHILDIQDDTIIQKKKGCMTESFNESQNNTDNIFEKSRDMCEASLNWIEICSFDKAMEISEPRIDNSLDSFNEIS